MSGNKAESRSDTSDSGEAGGGPGRSADKVRDLPGGTGGGVGAGQVGAGVGGGSGHGGGDRASRNRDGGHEHPRR